MQSFLVRAPGCGFGRQLHEFSFLYILCGFTGSLIYGFTGLVCPLAFFSSQKRVGLNGSSADMQIGLTLSSVSMLT